MVAIAKADLRVAVPVLRVTNWKLANLGEQNCCNQLMLSLSTIMPLSNWGGQVHVIPRKS